MQTRGSLLCGSIYKKSKNVVDLVNREKNCLTTTTVVAGTPFSQTPRCRSTLSPSGTRSYAAIFAGYILA